ncbi:MAG: relaxase MobL [Clostridia bacterium]|nr:relaxase MobL [Clostridia bacterium]
MPTNNVPPVVYIAEYIPTEKMIISNPKKYGKYLNKRNFYTSKNSSNDYVNYVHTGKPNEKIEDYIEYTADREKSGGIFSSNGLLTQTEINALKQSLRATQSPIWNGIISFEKEFGNELMESTDKAIELLKRLMPIFLKNAKFDIANITWYAGLHENTDNKHIHISFFENQPLRYRANKKGLHFSNGAISKYAMEKFKIDIELKLRDMQTYKLRDKLLAEFDKSKENFEKYHKKDLLKLADILPQGRIGYNSKNMVMYKDKVNSVVNKIMQNSTLLQKFLKDYKAKLNEINTAIKKSCGRNKYRQEKYMLKDTYLSSLYSKLGNKVIKNALKMQMLENDVNKIKGRTLKQRRIKKKSVLDMLAWSVKLNSYYDYLAMKSFQDHMAKLEEMRYKTMKEMGYFDYEM